jgi:rRNA-processing protein FCF1
LAKIVFDTDFLIKISNDPIPKFDLLELSKEHEFLVIPPVLQELEGLQKTRKVNTAKRARQTLRVIREKKFFKVLRTTGRDVEKRDMPSFRETDHILVEFIMEKPSDRILATMDGSLLSRLGRLGLPYLTLRNGRALFSSRMRATYLSPTKG